MIRSRKVDDRFYQIINHNHDRFVAFLCKSGMSEDSAKPVATKLIYQIIFLYFLQNKGWLGIKAFPDSLPIMDLCDLLSEADEDVIQVIDKAYYVLDDKAIREDSMDFDGNKIINLFKEYSEDWGTGSKTFLKDLFNIAANNDLNFYSDCLYPLLRFQLNQPNTHNYFDILKCKVPFLGSTLFDCDPAAIPNRFFMNTRWDGLLNCLDSYDFAKPEVLNDLFMNFISKEDAKSNGISSTPERLVDYMCQESLIEYLSAKVDIDRTSVSLLVKYGEAISEADVLAGSVSIFKMPAAIVDNIQKLDKALEEVTIIDPAAGSGSFCKSMLNQIVDVREIITKYFQLTGVKFDASARRRHALKVHTLVNSIYAVDINSYAVDVTKFRLWLDLISDGEVDILPNLENNIVQGDSVRDDFKDVKLFDLSKIDSAKPVAYKVVELLNEYITAQTELSDELDSDRRKELMDSIRSCEHQLIECMVLEDKHILKEDLEHLRNLKEKPYLLWDLVFNKPLADGGFDIVIGNPPFISLNNNRQLFKDITKSMLGKRVYQYGMNYSYLFMHRGLDLAKPGGIVSFVMQDFSESPNAENMRTNLRWKSTLLSCVRFKSSSFVPFAGKRDYLITITRKGDYNNCCLYIPSENADMTYINKSDIYDGETNQMLFKSKDIKVTGVLNKTVDEVMDDAETLNVAPIVEKQKSIFSDVIINDMVLDELAEEISPVEEVSRTFDNGLKAEVLPVDLEESAKPDFTDSQAADFDNSAVGEEPAADFEEPVFNSEEPIFNSTKLVFDSGKPAIDFTDFEEPATDFDNSAKPVFTDKQPVFADKQPDVNSAKPVFADKQPSSTFGSRSERRRQERKANKNKQFNITVPEREVNLDIFEKLNNYKQFKYDFTPQDKNNNVKPMNLFE